MIRDHKMDALIARMVEADFGRGDAEAIQALELFLQAHPELAEQHLAVAALWEELGDLEEPVEVASLSPEPSLPWRGNWHRLAAAIVPLFAVVAVFLFALDQSRDAGVLELRTGPGERRIVTLADGSSVRLAPSSMVRVELGEKSRELDLAAGEAMFDVSHDPARPFTVTAGDGKVRAIGTVFNVRLTGPDVVVTVVEGTISVTAGKEPEQQPSAAHEVGLVQLANAGEQVTYGTARLRQAVASESFISPARAVDVGRYTGWSNGLLRFDGEPLSVVVSEVNRYALEQVELADPALGAIPIYGVLHVGDTKGLVSIVQDSQSVSTGALNQKVRIVKRKAE